MKDKDGFVYVCINNNNNQQEGGTPTPPAELTSLNVRKNIDCESTGGSPNNDAVCEYVEANITPEDYMMIVTGNIPNPSQFPGSNNGTTVPLGEGAYTVTEELPFSLVTLADSLGRNANLINIADVDANSDCEAKFDTNIIFQEATGTISAGESQTCSITNTIHVLLGTVPSD